MRALAILLPLFAIQALAACVLFAYTGQTAWAVTFLAVTIFAFLGLLGSLDKLK